MRAHHYSSNVIRENIMILNFIIMMFSLITVDSNKKNIPENGCKRQHPKLKWSDRRWTQFRNRLHQDGQIFFWNLQSWYALLILLFRPHCSSDEFEHRRDIINRTLRQSMRFCLHYGDLYRWSSDLYQLDWAMISWRNKTCSKVAPLQIN